jgi:hypothetical protein
MIIINALTRYWLITADQLIRLYGLPFLDKEEHTFNAPGKHQYMFIIIDTHVTLYN